jgi:hypothetical protein
MLCKRSQINVSKEGTVHHVLSLLALLRMYSCSRDLLCQPSTNQSVVSGGIYLLPVICINATSSSRGNHIERDRTFVTTVVDLKVCGLL